MKGSFEDPIAPNNPGDFQCIIFSRNRAMQLDGVLRSLFFHCLDIKQAQITILYKADESHIRQYEKLMIEYAGLVNFKKQQHFRQDTLSVLFPPKKSEIKEKRYKLLSTLGSFGPPTGSLPDRVWRRTVGPLIRYFIMRLTPSLLHESYVLFLVDDNIFVRDFRLNDIGDALRNNKDLLGFSLRLGENTTYCYSLKSQQTLPSFIGINTGMLKYIWTKAEYDFGYPLEISSSVYRSSDMLPFLLSFPFENPTELENRMAFYANHFSAKYSCLGCYQLSVAFCNPINIVQKSSPNRAGESLWRHDTEDLAVRFERGERINAEAYNNFVPGACHQEVELVFENLWDRK